MPRVSAGRRAALTQKPPLGAVLQSGHPLASGLLGAFLLNEGGGQTLVNTGRMPLASQTWNGTSPTYGPGPDGIGLKTTAGDVQVVPATTGWGLTQAVRNNLTLSAVGVWSSAPGATQAFLALGLTTYAIGYDTTGGGLTARATDGTATVHYAALAGTPTAGTRYHLVGVFDTAGNITLYVNGVQAATTTTPSLHNDAISNLFISSTSASNNKFVGTLQHAYLWNRALSAEDVSRLYTDPYGMFGPPATRLWLVGSTATTYNQALTGSMAGAGGITRQTGKQTAGTVSPAGAITRQAAKALGASITEGGALIRSSSKVLSGATTPAGGLQLQTGKGLTSLLTPAGSIIRQAGKSLAGSSTFAGSVQVQTGKALAAALTPAATLASAAMHVLSVVLAATLTPAGGMVRQTNRVLSSVLTPTGTLLRTTARLLSASLAGVGSLLAGIPHLFLVALAASITPAGALHRRIGRVLGAALGVIGFLAGTPVRRTPVRVHPRTVGETPPLLRVQAAGPTTRTVQQAPSWRLRIVAEPAEPLPPVALPEGTRVVPLGSAVRVLQAGAPEHTVARPTPIVRIVRRK